MARKKKRVHEMIDTKTENLIPPVPAMRKLRIPMPLTKIALAVLILGIVAIFVSNKGLLVAAIVNGRPIFRWQLNQAMTARFGQQTLEGMISEALIADEARKSGISVSQADIDAKVSDIVASLGGTVSIDDLLKYQGMSRGEFENQIRLQLTVEKLLGRDIVVTDDDVKDALDFFVNQEVASICEGVNGSGRFGPTSKAVGKQGRFSLMLEDVKAFVEGNKAGFERLGAERSYDVTSSIAYRDTDESGEVITPLFERKAFGNLDREWDS